MTSSAPKPEGARAEEQVPQVPQRDASEARAVRRAPKGKDAWDKERTHELFRLYKEKGDEEARDQLIVSHLNLVRVLDSKF